MLKAFPPGRHSRMVAIKDEKTGKMASHTLTSQVIVSAIMSSTSHDINPENASRCFLVNADESGEQTARIHASQREKYSLSRYFDRLHSVPRIIARHHAAQRLLRPLLIVNPFAEHLDFPRSLIRTRRDHERFVDLIACVCFLRQYQKESKRSRDPESGKEVEYVECDIEDYRIAYTIMTGGVMSSTYAEIPRAMAAFYEELRELFRARARADGPEDRGGGPHAAGDQEGRSAGWEASRRRSTCGALWPWSTCSFPTAGSAGCETATSSWPTSPWSGLTSR